MIFQMKIFWEAIKLSKGSLDKMQNQYSHRLSYSTQTVLIIKIPKVINRFKIMPCTK
jgi:hypothetical protein